MILVLILLSLLATPESEEQKPFIVVELFTSEGCSSCPSADRLLSKIVDHDYENVEVIGLSFHVDYWDYIGWKDPYAHKKFTQRQRVYAQKLKSHQVYTPQMVVNGKYEFVGSDKGKWNQLSEKLSKENPKYDLKIDNISLNNNQIKFEASANDTRELILNVAIVERGLSQNVKTEVDYLVMTM
ncbi:MAG: DUF1223 domain-containing protein [Cyclobacteriaceae bacterium]